MREILYGAGIILIGLVMGGSIFQGDFGVLSILFDGIGILLILRGVIRLIHNRRSEP
jgi:hypothetical protein